VPSPSVPLQVVRSQDLDWQPDTVPGVQIAIVHQDERKREIIGFLRAEPGVHYPMHRHAAVEEIYMQEGELVIGDEVYKAGDYIRARPGSKHAPYTISGCQFFFRTSMDDDYSASLLEV
ncbi:MAG: anti-sigma factor, partial [Leptolyngbya sp. SIO1D8]|nr:anti-sigma factor [Leptolyngbya sp. SIO1D8]